MLDWLSPLGEWVGLNESFVPLLLLLILIVLIIGLIRG